MAAVADTDADAAVEVPLPLDVEEFLTWLAVERGRSPNTLAAYRRDLRAYHRWLLEQSFTLDDVREATVTSYVAHFRESGRAPSSVARAMVAVRALHRFRADEQLVTNDPAAEVELPRVPRGLPKALSEDDVERLLGAVVGDEPTDRRDRAILEVLYGTGLRISELVGLSLSDIDLEGGLLRAFGKGAKERVVPLGRMAREALEGWLSVDGRDRLVPERGRRRDDADAVFLNARGGRLSRQGGVGRRAEVRRSGRSRRATHTTRPASFVRDPHARSRRRHPSSARATRARLDQHDAGVHDGVHRAVAGGVRIGASTRVRVQGGGSLGRCDLRRRAGI